MSSTSDEGRGIGSGTVTALPERRLHASWRLPAGEAVLYLGPTAAVASLDGTPEAAIVAVAVIAGCLLLEGTTFTRGTRSPSTWSRRRTDPTSVGVRRALVMMFVGFWLAVVSTLEQIAAFDVALTAIGTALVGLAFMDRLYRRMLDVT